MHLRALVLNFIERELFDSGLISRHVSHGIRNHSPVGKVAKGQPSIHGSLGRDFFQPCPHPRSSLAPAIRVREHQQFHRQIFQRQQTSMLIIYVKELLSAYLYRRTIQRHSIARIIQMIPRRAIHKYHLDRCSKTGSGNP